MSNVYVYTRSSCAPCQTLKMWLNRKNVSYTELNVDDPKIADRLITLTGTLLLPTVVIGETIIKGLNIGKIAKAIDN
jgi:glutaredoxin 3